MRTGPVAPNLRPRGAPPAFGVMVKPIGAVCNLDCEYCYYLTKQELYPHDKPRMTRELMRTYVRQMLESQPRAQVNFVWQGGEPTLMGVPFFKDVIVAVEEYRLPGQPVTHALQTNGTLLDDEWGEFLAANEVLVGISIDGPPELHDRYRLDKRGRPTAERVLAGLEILRRHTVEHNILCTVNSVNAEHPLEVYRYFRDELNEQFLQFIPIVEQGRGGEEAPGEAVEVGTEPPDACAVVSDRSVKPEQWGRFLCAIFDEWSKRDIGNVFVQQFDSTLGAWLGAPSPVCVFAETCGVELVLEHNGDIYSCDHFVEPSYRLGNITETHLLELVSSEAQQRFGQAKRDSLPRECIECDVRFACRGECPKNRFLQTADGEAGLNYLCAGYKQFFHHTGRPMQLMADLVRQHRPPRELMWA